LPEWQDSRQPLSDKVPGAEPHPFTDQVAQAIVGEVKRNRDGGLDYRWDVEQ
jgi:hypothetical protein